ncbi:HdeD family acid-resistance protein [Formosa haliotis]|uniref:HdeD family acid-resistance protein n=1 Tax=Formosa haliotis TaxID=1555194 RepID=UPI000826C5FF|nr:DUF308 domain-containing protein [Formosa haliotis]
MKDTISNTVKHWWIPLVSGFLFIFLGILVFKTPVTSYLALTIFFEIGFLVTGILQIVYSISNKAVLTNWGWGLTSGIIDLFLAILLFANPGLSAAILPIYIGFMLLFRSMLGIGYSVDLKQWGVQEWGWILFGSILGVIFSSLMIMNPAFGSLSIVIYTGLSIVMLGMVQISIALSLKKIKKEIKDDEVLEAHPI